MSISTEYSLTLYTPSCTNAASLFYNFSDFLLSPHIWGELENVEVGQWVHILFILQMLIPTHHLYCLQIIHLLLGWLQVRAQAFRSWLPHLFPSDSFWVQERRLRFLHPHRSLEKKQGGCSLDYWLLKCGRFSLTFEDGNLVPSLGVSVVLIICLSFFTDFRLASLSLNLCWPTKSSARLRCLTEHPLLDHLCG